MKRAAGGILSFFVTGVAVTVALMVWGWWFILWIFIGAIAITAIGEALKEISLMNKEER